MQTDLFGTPSVTARVNPAASKADFLQRTRFSLRLDQAVVMLIALLVVYVLVFSFGVEKGKRFAMAEIRAERGKREKIMQELQAKLFSEAGSPQTQESPAPVIKAIKIESPVVINEEAPSPPKGKYTIQMVTFTAEKDVERVMKKLTEAGHQGFVLPNGRYLQVCVESFDSRHKASRLLGELKSRRIVPQDAYVRFVS